MLYRIVRDHFETFRAEAAAARDGEGLPGFVEQAFRDFLRCGWLAGGFARFRCGGCGLDRLVAFSCKGRALCPSCGGRRMAERAAHLVDHVFPDVPVRQWVLKPSASPPVSARVGPRPLPRRRGHLRSCGVPPAARTRAAGIEAGRAGGVVVIQRFGGALNLNLHFHALVLDGVFAPKDDGTVAFHRFARLATLDVEEVLATIEPLIARRIRRRGLAAEENEAGATDRWADEAPVLAGLAAASVQGRVGLGRRHGARPSRLGTARPWVESPTSGTCQARADGFSLHAALVVPGGQRERLERVCRYVLRPSVAAERLQLTDDGQVRLWLRQPWRDGTTAFVFDPVEFLGRLAVLVPRPRINLVLYYGVLGLRSAWRADVVRRDRSDASDDRTPSDARAGPDRARGQQWAALMQRTFGFDVLACPRCGGRLRLIALIEEPAVMARILRHLGLPAEIPSPRPARAPPVGDRVADAEGCGDLAVCTPGS